MIGSFLSWYILISLAGAGTIPLTFRVFKNLPDRGYPFCRISGLLLWGYIFWLLGSFRILQNDPGGIALALALVFLISIISIQRTGLKEIMEWFRNSKTTVIVTELLFFAAFAGWTLIRAADPAALGTEKPMELAFINAILRSPVLPPHDPWLSGYAISYYYFGYVMVAMMAKLSAVSGAVAFNLASSLWFGLTAVGGFGVLFNLVSKITRDEDQKIPLLSKMGASLWGLLAPVFILIVSNLEGFLEVLHSKGIFWKTNADSGTLESPFWKWLDIQELVNPPTLPFSWIPQRNGGIWWWRASRVLQDYDLAGNSREIIDEFPFFSYLLGDLHPHVLAMPFVMLATGMALSVFYGGREKLSQNKGIFHAIRDWLSGKPFEWSAVMPGGLLRQKETWATALIIGSLAFLNTWDFPIYVGLYCAILVFLRYQRSGWRFQLIWEFLELVIIFAILGVMLYFPFYLGFASQAGGIIPSMAFFTRGVHFWVMFGALLIPICAWMVWFWRQHRRDIHYRNGFLFAGVLIGAIWLVSMLLGWFAASLPILGNLILMSSPGAFLGKIATDMISAGSQFYGLQGASSAGRIVFESFLKRLVYPGAWLTLFFLLASVWSFLGSLHSSGIENGVSEDNEEIIQKPDGFVFLLVFVGIGLTLVPEFIYLRDQFGWRMNTIFKFYFQTWMLWAIAAAYGSVILWKKLKTFWRTGFAVVWLLVLAAGLAYPFFGLRMKSMMMPGGLSLDGAGYLERYAPDEMEAIRFLENAPAGIVAEAIGGSYSSFARVSELSGNPTVLGWPGHESQWRGGATEMGSREADIRTLYRTSDWNEAKTILERYNIRYVYIGSQERSAYRVNETKFSSFMKPVFSNQGVVIYERIYEEALKE